MLLRLDSYGALTATIFSLSVLSCGDELDNVGAACSDVDIQNKTLAGVVGGVSWEYVYAQARSSGDNVAIEVFGTTPGSTCTITTEADITFFLATIPSLGEVDVKGEGRSINFSSSGGGASSTSEWCLNVIGDGSTGFTAVISAQFDADNTVEGQFAVSNCP